MKKVIIQAFLFAFVLGYFLPSYGQSTSKRRAPYDFSKPTRSQIKPSKFRLYLEYSPEYDSNILKYSQFEIDRFNQGTEPIGKATPISSLSDWSHCFGVRTTYEHFFIRRNKTSYGLTARWYAYSNSSIFNHGSLWFKFQQELSRTLDFRFEYSFLDNVALRNFTDRDTREWHTAEYDFSEYRFKFPLHFRKKLDLTPLYSIRRIYYNNYFTEFDSEGNSLGFEIGYKVKRTLHFSLEYKFITMENVGKSQTTGSAVLDPISADSEYGDSSYEENDMTFSGSYDFDLADIGTFQLGVDYRLRNRVYTTNLSYQDAPFHRDRKHRLTTIGFELSNEPIRFTTISTRLEFEKRVTTSPNPNVPKYKNYQATRFSIKMSYRLF